MENRLLVAIFLYHIHSSCGPKLLYGSVGDGKSFPDANFRLLSMEELGNLAEPLLHKRLLMERQTAVINHRSDYIRGLVTSLFATIPNGVMRHNITPFCYSVYAFVGASGGGEVIVLGQI